MNKDEIRVAVQSLLERGGLDKGAPAYGVALKIVDAGYASLTRAQRILYERVIAPQVNNSVRDR